MIMVLKVLGIHCEIWSCASSIILAWPADSFPIKAANIFFQCFGRKWFEAFTWLWDLFLYEEFEDQIRDLSGTLGDLDKLAKIDEELLAKYSKVYFLNENYAPEKVDEINDRYVLEGKDDQYFDARAIDFLEDMLRDASRDDIDLKVVSAYRSFDEQSVLKGQFTQAYGSGANTFSADQGYSEHQLGTTVDLTIESVGGTYTSFAQTEAYEWLLDNAYKHGFILSYPEDNGFYVFEPWHWRFVGEDLARDLQRSDDTFYSLDQREIDEYRLEMFD